LNLNAGHQANAAGERPVPVYRNGEPALGEVGFTEDQHSNDI
jgi:hypothetical protein